MNALKKYKERQYRDKAREIVNENMDNFIEHMERGEDGRKGE